MESRRQWLPPVAAGLLLFALAVASQFVRVTYGAGGPTPPAVRAGEVPSADRARLTVIDGVPVARLSGTSFEVGRQHGSIFRKQIRFLQKEYFEALAVRAVGRAEIDRWAKAVAPHIPAHLKEELRGLAEGCGLSYDEVLSFNCMVDRLQSMMCSTVVASGEATEGGEILFGRNLDFPGRNVLHRSTVVLVVAIDGKTPVLTITWPGLIGMLSGMNEHGVAGATMMIHQGKKIRPGLPYMMMYREALAAARKATDVYGFINGSRRTCPNNFMVVDKDGTAEVLEWDQDIVERLPAPQGCACSTNYFRSKRLENTAWRLGKSRYKTLDRFLASEQGKINLSGIKRVLKDVARPWFMNVQSMVFLPARQSMHLAVGDKLPMAGQRWVHLPREVLFGKQGKQR